MHLIERYALSTGLKIDNPVISEQFFPTSCEGYVCFHASSKDNLRDYDYWNETKNLLEPFFKKLNIKTLQIGLEKDPSLSCDIDLRGRTNMRQMAYIVKNCDLFIGVDSFPAHLAGFFNRKMVSIYSNSFAACVRPYWGDRSNQKIIETDRPDGEKPSFSFNENPKTVNRIKPEKIANSALSLLGLDSLKYKTIFMGEMCRQKHVEIIPRENTEVISESATVRMDLDHNEEVLKNIIQRNFVEVILTEPIDESLLVSKKIKNILYKNDNFNADFIKKVKRHGVPLALVCNKKENVSSLRASFFDLFIYECNESKIIEQNKERFKHNLNQLKIKSGKKIVCGNKIYQTLYEFNGKKNKDDFFLDLDWFFIYADGDE
jgi:hypothetical protein